MTMTTDDSQWKYITDAAKEIHYSYASVLAWATSGRVRSRQAPAHTSKQRNGRWGRQVYMPDVHRQAQKGKNYNAYRR